jgi:hypothetical protein
LFAKIIVPLSMLLLGCAAWVFFRQCGFAPWVLTVIGSRWRPGVCPHGCWALRRCFSRWRPCWRLPGGTP